MLGPVRVAAPPPPPSVHWPELSRRVRIQGVVRLHALISREGTIEDLKVVSGHPLLVRSALEAVKQWAYEPTLLNGEPAGVEADIDMNFTLSP